MRLVALESFSRKYCFKSVKTNHFSNNSNKVKIKIQTAVVVILAVGIKFRLKSLASSEHV